MQKILAALGGAIVLIVGLTVSVVAFAVIAALAVIFGLYFWWKTRALRAHLAEQARRRPREAEAAGSGTVIEGEWSRDAADPGAPGATAISEPRPLPRAGAADAPEPGSPPRQ